MAELAKVTGHEDCDFVRVYWLLASGAGSVPINEILGNWPCAFGASVQELRNHPYFR
jgi:hypothetical protein